MKVDEETKEDIPPRKKARLDDYFRGEGDRTGELHTSVENEKMPLTECVNLVD